MASLAETHIHTYYIAIVRILFFIYNIEIIILAPVKPVKTSSIKTVWSGNSLSISWEPLTLHEARGFPVYYIYLSTSSGPVDREIEPTANTTESSIVIDGLDSSRPYIAAVEVATGTDEEDDNLFGPVSESGNYHVINYNNV